MFTKLVKISLIAFALIVCTVTFAYAITMEGQPAIDFKLPGLFDTSKVYSLSDFAGKVVLLNIWASWCTGCQDEMPEFITLADEFKDKGLAIVAASVDNNAAKAVDFLKGLEAKTGKNLNFTVLYDKDKKIANDYKPRGMPATYLIDKTGKIANIFPGSFTAANIGTLKSAIGALLK
ncbi:MAG: TlpA family protein disulfide reductase [Nitrospirae bacterium]|nr:TlpA family protein disulfide reductase [Nitrospirota bacterium]MBF0535569.1 TlpA family protein disulfide reductase [Nitrospirota bacterium]MBF0617404.1 TlpA family protein disulfide reductase [Nitrospirota bacterium]